MTNYDDHTWHQLEQDLRRRIEENDEELKRGKERLRKLHYEKCKNYRETIRKLT